MPNQNGKPIPAPYLPYKSFQKILLAFKESGIPPRIGRDVLSGRSGTEQTMLLNAFTYLGLMSADGTPSETLQHLVTSDGPARQKILRDILTVRYSFLSSGKVNLENTTPSILLQALGTENLGGDTARKGMTFLLAAAQDAGMPLSSYLKVRQGRPIGTRKKQRSPLGGAQNAGTGVLTPAAKTAPTKTEPYEVLWEMLDPQGMSEEEKNAVWTLLNYLKKKQTEKK